MFFPKIHLDNNFNKNSKGKKREFDKLEEKSKPNNNDRKIRFQKKTRTAGDKFMTGFTINNSGNTLFLQKSFSTRYYREVLDTNEQCKQKNNCNFVHKLYSNQSPENEMKMIKYYAPNTEDLTFHNSVKFTRGDNNDSSGNNSNKNKDNNKNKGSEVSN